MAKDSKATKAEASNAPDSSKASDTSKASDSSKSSNESSGSNPSLISMAVFFAVVAGMVGLLQYVDRPELPAPSLSKIPRTILTKPLKRGMMTAEMLAQHGGTNPKKSLYLAIMGEVFDVTKGKDFYGPPDGGYAFFSGKDGSRAFVTGEFNETGLIPDLEGFTASQYEGIVGWNEFYHKEEKYPFVAKLIGHYWDEDGNPTAARKMVDQMRGIRDTEKAEEKAFNQKYPGCNSKWAQQTGGEVWCSQKSGGIDREWVGVPRKYVTKKGSTDERKKCVCVRVEIIGSLDSETFEPYANCDATSEKCST